MSRSVPECFRVSIIIPVRNEAASIGALLDHMVSHTGADCEIIVADGASDDGTGDILHSYASTYERVVIVDNPGRYTSGGLNRAIKRARGEYIVRMDAHTRYADDYIETCIEELERTGADNVGGPQLAEASGYTGSAIAVACHSPLAVGGSRIHDPQYEGPTDAVIYGCWRRSLFERVGYFDEELVRNQDGEHNRRIARNGGVTWQTPRIRSWYRPRGDVVSVGRQYAQYGFWKAREIQKFRRIESLRHCVPGVFVAVMTVFLLAGLFYRPLLVSFVVLAGCYLVFLAASALYLSARERAWRYLPVIPLVFAAMQVGYGYGFLRGVWNFWVRGRDGRERFSELTR